MFVQPQVNIWQRAEIFHLQFQEDNQSREVKLPSQDKQAFQCCIYINTVQHNVREPRCTKRFLRLQDIFIVMEIGKKLSTPTVRLLLSEINWLKYQRKKYYVPFFCPSYGQQFPIQIILNFTMFTKHIRQVCPMVN